MGRQSSAVAWGTLATILAILALLAANGSGQPLSIRDTPLVILGLSFIALIAVMTTVSLAARMRLSIQLLTIYFTIYLLLPGFNHSSTNRFPFFLFSYPLDVRISAAWMVAIFLIALLASYVVAGLSLSDAPRARAATVAVRFNPGLALVLVTMALVSLAIFLGSVGLAEAFTPRTADIASEIDNTGNALNVTLPRTLVFLPVIYATLLVRYSWSKAAGLVLLAITLPVLLVVDFPLAIARSQIFGYLLLFAMLLANFKRAVNRTLLSLLFVLGALVAMPVFDQVTRGGKTLADFDPQLALSNYFNTGDFDGFQSVNNAVVYVTQQGTENGRQLLSAALFFVPRAAWPGKGEPTGSITAEAAGYTFTNISQPLPSEFYVDFGWAGVVLGAALLGFCFVRLDRWFDRGWNTDVRTRLAAGWLMGFGLPIFRGTLLGVLPPFIILAFGLWVIARFGTHPIRDPVRDLVHEPVRGPALAAR